jgi:hypothetical protein
VIVKDGYHSGGSGYVISNEAFTRLGTQLNKNYKFCKNTGTEDVDVNDCMRSLGVTIERSVDDLGRPRFLVLSLMAHFWGHFPDWLLKYSKYPIQKVL